MSVVRTRLEALVRGAAVGLAAACLVAPSIGCRSGSWGTKPSWMTFGQKPTDTAPLSSAPAFAGDVQKPSATAKPYPTTSTPEGYSLPEAGAQAATAPGATPAAVTYGATPPPAAASYASSTPSGVTASAASTAAVAPQVGRYAASTSPPADPAFGQPASAAAAPPLAAVPPAAPLDQTVGGQQPPATLSTAPPPWASSPAAAPAATPSPRYADARAASPQWNPTPIEPSAGAADGRYATGNASRFSDVSAPVAASLVPPAVPMESPAAPAAQSVTPPGAFPTPAALPATPSAPAPSAPLRRPDPGYRPGGTSSYRSSRATLAGEPPQGVMPASFEATATGGN